MTPKEKAFELSMKFDKLGETDNAKQCALICVDEILDIMQEEYFSDAEKLQFWQEVKKEIEQL